MGACHQDNLSTMKAVTELLKFGMVRDSPAQFKVNCTHLTKPDGAAMHFLSILSVFEIISLLGSRNAHLDNIMTVFLQMWLMMNFAKLSNDCGQHYPWD